jgi:hypothetical protein
VVPTIRNDEDGSPIALEEKTVNQLRRRLLDEGKQRELLAILSVGCSQNMAAKYVGCSPRTIRREAARDPKFAKKLRQAKCNAELGLIKNIRKAANKEQYWRAAAWALERCFPEKYARRGPDVITSDQLAQIMEQLVERILRHVHNVKDRKVIVKDVELLARSFGQTIREEESADETG